MSIRVGDPRRDLADARQCGKVIYPLAEILLLSLLAVLAGQGSLREDVEIFVNEQKTQYLKDAVVRPHPTVDGDHGRIETRHLVGCRSDTNGPP